MTATTKTTEKAARTPARKLTTGKDGTVYAGGAPLGKESTNGTAERPVTPSGVPCYNWTKNGTLKQIHVRILEVLSKAKNALSAESVAGKLGTKWVNPVSWAIHAGKSGDPFSLLGRKLVSSETVERDGVKVRCFAITAAGRKALEKAKAAK